MKLLEVDDLTVTLNTARGPAKAVRGVSFNVLPGETVGIVGESGCGKSVTAMSLLGLVQRPGKVVHGEIMFKGQDLLKLNNEELRNIRGRDIAMIFQDPLSSLNPVLRIGFQIDEAMRAHDKIPRDDISHRGIDLLKQVRVPDAAHRGHHLPLECRREPQEGRRGGTRGAGPAPAQRPADLHVGDPAHPGTGPGDDRGGCRQGRPARRRRRAGRGHLPERQPVPAGNLCR